MIDERGLKSDWLQQIKSQLGQSLSCKRMQFLHKVVTFHGSKSIALEAIQNAALNFERLQESTIRKYAPFGQSTKLEDAPWNEYEGEARSRHLIRADHALASIDAEIEIAEIFCAMGFEVTGSSREAGAGDWQGIVEGERWSIEAKTKLPEDRAEELIWSAFKGMQLLPESVLVRGRLRELGVDPRDTTPTDKALDSLVRAIVASGPWLSSHLSRSGEIQGQFVDRALGVRAAIDGWPEDAYLTYSHLSGSTEVSVLFDPKKEWMWTPGHPKAACTKPHLEGHETAIIYKRAKEQFHKERLLQSSNQICALSWNNPLGWYKAVDKSTKSLQRIADALEIDLAGIRDRRPVALALKGVEGTLIVLGATCAELLKSERVLQAAYTEDGLRVSALL